MFPETLLTSEAALTNRALELLLFEVSDIDVPFEVKTRVVNFTAVGSAAAVLHY